MVFATRVLSRYAFVYKGFIASQKTRQSVKCKEFIVEHYCFDIASWQLQAVCYTEYISSEHTERDKAMKNLNISKSKTSKREVSAAAWDKKMRVALDTIAAAEYRIANSTNETIIAYAHEEIAKVRKTVAKLELSNPYVA